MERTTIAKIIATCRRCMETRVGNGTAGHRARFLVRPLASPEVSVRFSRTTCSELRRPIEAGIRIPRKWIITTI